MRTLTCAAWHGKCSVNAATPPAPSGDGNTDAPKALNYVDPVN